MITAEKRSVLPIYYGSRTEGNAKPIALPMVSYLPIPEDFVVPSKASLREIYEILECKVHSCSRGDLTRFQILLNRTKIESDAKNAFAKLLDKRHSKTAQEYFDLSLGLLCSEINQRAAT